MSVTDAVEQGLVVAEVKTVTKEMDKAEADSNIVSTREVAYTIQSVIDPVTGNFKSYLCTGKCLNIFVTP